MKGSKVVDYNTKATEPVRNWRRPPLRYSREMQVALERARLVQPPLKSMAGNASDPWRSE